MKRAVFLDRDGTINVDRGYVHRREDFAFLPGAVDALRKLQDAGYLLILITNQSGIGRGMFTETEYLVFQDWISEALRRQGVYLTAQYYCPHVDEDYCDCRKPRMGLFERAARELDIDWNESYAIGDRLRDLSVCEKYGVRGYLVGDTETDVEKLPDGVKRVTDLAEAANEIAVKPYYIFGAHSRAQTTATYIRKLHPDWGLLGFLFDDDERNPDCILGHPVLDLRADCELDTSARVYLGIRGVGFAHATEALQAAGFTDIVPVDVELDRNLRMQYMKLAFAEQEREFALLENLPAYGTGVNAQIGIAHALGDGALKNTPGLKPEETYVQAGTSLDGEQAADCRFYDNDGENISNKNRQFCELTVLYWLWKNCSSEWIGLEHYRRRFILPEDWTARLGQVDAILPVPLYVYPSLEGNFVARHKKQVWEMAIQILSEQHPDMQEAATEFFSKQGCYSPCNMLIARREVLDNLCSWLFPMLFDLEGRVGMLEDSYQNRYPGFVSERFISFFFWYYRDKYNVVYSEKNFLS